MRKRIYRNKKEQNRIHALKYYYRHRKDPVFKEKNKKHCHNFYLRNREIMILHSLSQYWADPEKYKLRQKEYYLRKNGYPQA